MQRFRDRALFDVQCTMPQMREDLNLNFLAYVDGVGLIKGKTCLDGTRTEILKEIVDWINNTDPAAPRMFWLHGQAGRGKSAIAHTIAMQARNLGVLGSCFCFTRDRQHEGLHVKLFPTIARDLADRDLRLRPLLAEMITNDRMLRGTADVAEQWEKFIVEPLSRLEGSSTGNVVVVIDALDESGAESTRGLVLELLSTRHGNLPGNVRILLTSRPLVDICRMLKTTPHIQARSLDDNVESSIGDVQLYISDRLKKLGGTFADETLQQLATKSGGVFEWARLACDFVSHPVSVIAKKRLAQIQSHDPGDGNTLLDKMYTTFLEDIMQRQSDVLVMFRSVMQQILWLKKPLSISALDFIRDMFPRVDDRYPVGEILNMMASLLCGTNEASTPIRPLHASFYDFLQDKRRSGKFVIQEGNIHHDLAIASLSVMQTCLCFNICGLETSYVLNSEVVDLAKRVEEKIPSHLLYACQFWANHLKDVKFNTELAQSVGEFVAGEKMLFWLEALGVSKLIREADKVLIIAERWFQVRLSYFGHACMLCQ